MQTYIPRQGQSDFTPRQKDIVNLIEKGFTNQEIAHQLSVRVNTIKNHKSRLFRKTNVKSTIELLRVTRDLRMNWKPPGLANTSKLCLNMYVCMYIFSTFPLYAK